MNVKERCDIIRAMDILVRIVNNEDYIVTWLRLGVADGDIRPNTVNAELQCYTENVVFADLMDIFLRIMGHALKDGGLCADGIVSKSESLV